MRGTCLIPLTQGKVAIVDAEDYPALSSYAWYARKNSRSDKFYAASHPPRCGQPQKTIYMHRLILGVSQGIIVDHVSHLDTLDNRRANLRIASESQNRCNVPVRNPIGVKGISWFEGRIWRAVISFDRKKYHLGLFRDLEEAIAARKRAERELHGEFACKGAQ